MIKDTTYDLEVRLQRVEASLSTVSTGADTNIDLEDEKAVTSQCLRVCENAQSYLKSLQHSQAPLRQEATTPEGTIQSQFEAEVLMDRAFTETRRHFIQAISPIRERLASIISTEGAERELEKSRLREDIDLSKQCLEVCQMATDQVHHHRKIHTIGDAQADHDSDQVVVTTIADLFDVRKAIAKNRSAQLVGSMDGETLRQISRDRYSSRFGAVTGDLGQGQTGIASLSSNIGVREGSTQRPDPATKRKRTPSAETTHDSPSPNEARKRAAEGEGSI
jgi:hypothetical protein